MVAMLATVLEENRGWDSLYWSIDYYHNKVGTCHYYM